MNKVNTGLMEELKSLARLQVRMDLLRLAGAERTRSQVRELAITEVLSFVHAQPEQWRDARGVLLAGERSARVDLATRYMSPGLEAYLSGHGVTTAEFVDAFGSTDRKAFVLAVLDASEKDTSK